MNDQREERSQATICPDVSVIEGRAWSPEIRAHVATCGSCKLVLELVEERSQAAASRDRRLACARFEALIAARVSGSIDASAARLLDEHLRECDDCRVIAETLAPANDAISDHATLPWVDAGAYALGPEVARGGMGRILSARDLRIGRSVAVKELLAKTSSQAARFEREARVTARLQHPGIVPIYEIGRWENGTPFYSMRMVEGRTLHSAIAGARTLAARLALVPAVIAATEAVAFAHSSGVIHRDLTPANIIVGDYGETVVIDWGLAKDLSDDREDEVDAGPYRRDPDVSSELTAEGAIIGTAAYMPPEQAAGDRVDARADVYALGALLYHLLTGRAPYHGKTDQVLVQVKQGAPPPIPATAPHDLVSIIEKAMAREPTDRYPSARELADELTKFQAGRLVGAHAYTRGELVRRWVRRNRRVLAVGVVALAVLAGVSTFAIVRVIDERDLAEVQGSVARDRGKESHALSVSLLAEQGRQELLAGHPTRALPFLSAAYSAGDASPDTRFMIAAAAHEVDGLEHVLRGAPAEVADLAFSPDGERLLAVKGPTIEVWDLVRGGPIRVLRVEGAPLTDAVFSPDGSSVAAWVSAQTTNHPTIYLFDVASGAMRRLDGHTHSSARVMFTPDGKHLVSVSWDSTWRRWDLESGESRAYQGSPPMFGRVGPVGAGAPMLDAKGERLITLASNGKVELWDVATGARLFEVASRPTFGAAVHPSGTRVLTWNLDELVLWDVRTKSVVARRPGPGHHLLRCAFRDDGQEILAVGDSGKVEMWDAALATQTATLTEAAGMTMPTFAGPHRIAITNLFGGRGATIWDPGLETRVAAYAEAGEQTKASVDGRRLVTAQRGGSIEVWRLDRSRLRRRFTATDIVGSNVSLDGSRVVAIAASGIVTLHDAEHGVSLSHPPLRQPIDLAGSRVAAMTPEGDVIVLDSSNGVPLHRWHPSAAPLGLELTADGAHLLVSHANGSEVRELVTGQVSATIPVGGTAARIAADGSRVMVLATPRELVVWDVTQGKKVATVALEAPPLFDLFFVSHDGSRVSVPGLFGETLALMLFETSSGRALAKLDNAVIPSFAPGHDRMIAAGSDGILHVLRLSDGVEVAKLPIEASSSAAQITADGTRIAITKVDGVSEVRSIVDGRVLARFPMRPPIPDIDAVNRTFSYSFTVANGFNGIRDDLFVTGNKTGSAIATWDIHLETRSVAEIAKLVEDRVPWRLEGGRLVRREVP